MMMRWFLGCYHGCWYLYVVVVAVMMMMIHLFHDQDWKLRRAMMVMITRLMMLLLKTIHGCEQMKEMVQVLPRVHYHHGY